jgi:hypothetical protein
VGQQVRLEQQQRQRHRPGRAAPQVIGPAIAGQRQTNEQENDRQPRQKDNTLNIVVVLPQEEIGELVPPFAPLPTGVVGRQPQLRHRQQRQGAQRVDEWWMLQTKPRIAGAQKSQPAGDVVLLVHRRAVAHGAVEGQEEKQQHNRHHRPDAPVGTPGSRHLSRRAACLWHHAAIIEYLMQRSPRTLSTPKRPLFAYLAFLAIFA